MNRSNSDCQIEKYYRYFFVETHGRAVAGVNTQQENACERPDFKLAKTRIVNVQQPRSAGKDKLFKLSLHLDGIHLNLI